MNWLKTLNDALEYVEEHIDEEIDVQDITKMVHSSYHHFVRTFHILSGVTLVEYIRKRRLTLAANDLVGSNVKVIDIAYKYQYSTPESFSKAFKEFHGVSPRDAKNFKGGLKSYSKLSFKIQIGGISEMTYKMVHKDVLEFSGYVIEVETKNGQNFIDIPAFYADFKAYQAGDVNYKSTTRDVKLIIDSLKAAKVIIGAPFKFLLPFFLSSSINATI